VSARPVIQRVARRAAAEVQLRLDPVRYFRRQGFRIGERCRLIHPTYGMLGTEPSLVTIGDHVTVSDGVLLVTHDGGVWVLRDRLGPVDVFGPITICDNVFVGARSVLLPGVTIGRGSLVGAGAVVTRSVPEDVVVAGSPARIVGTTSQYEERLRPFFHQTAGMSFPAKQEYLRAVDPSTLLQREPLPRRGSTQGDG
jgi:carbonic anhydrase/acetyltransferase-like protein (isoleucine patch superfamily)